MSVFTGLRVLDFSSHLAGAMAAMHLGDFGAEVIKIDAAAEDRGRREPGYLAWNRNKLRLQLDLESDQDRRAALDLLPGADVAIFDHGPGMMRRLGMDAATLTPDHPHLIHAWAPPYGERGRQSDMPASQVLLAALSGNAMRQPSYSGSPVHLIAPILHYTHANCLAAAIAAAVFERRRSGQGQAVVVSGLQGAAQASPTTVLNDVPAPVLMGAPLGGAPSYRLYRCGDGDYLFLACLFPNFYLRALDVLDVLGEILSHPEIEGDLDAALVAPGALITRGILEATFLTRPRAEWLELLQGADIPCGPVQTRERWFASETVAANGLRVTLDHADLGPVSMPGVSLSLTGTPAVPPRLSAETSLESLPPTSPRPAEPRGAARATPLAGVTVLDLGNVIAAPYAGSILAGFGAEVIKVEAREGDPFRYPAVFHSFNRGKQSLSLDLKQDEGRRLFLDLVAQADVVLDNFRHGVRERLGITYEQLRAVNPRIISLSVTGYGSDTPRQTMPAFDPILQAASGLMQAQGGPDDEPVFHAIAVNDVTTASLAAFAVVAALHARETTGEGQQIDSSLAATSVLAQIGEFVDFPGAPRPLAGSRDCVGVRALERFYACEDGWIAIACQTQAHYRALRQALDLPEDEDPAIALVTPRDGALADRLAGRLRTLTRAAAVDRLLAAGAPAASIHRDQEVFEDAFLAENGFFESYRHPHAGRVTAVAGFARFAAAPPYAAPFAPGLAEHSVEVLRRFGISEDRIQSLIEAGVVFQASPPGAGAEG